MHNEQLLQFQELVRDVKACTKCARMMDSERVLGPACGPLEATITVVGEAPGRLGADATAIPFHGDKSGQNFEALLQQVGLNRYQLFVTNAVLCNPRDDQGNNSTPTLEEIRNCSPFLKRQIELLDSPLVVTLGRTALLATALIESHSFTLKADVRTARPWFRRVLIPAYHPGQRAMLHRSFANQLSDYQFIKEIATRPKAKAKNKASTIRSSARDLVDEITRHKDELSYFALHKLAFLIEAKSLDELGGRLTDSYVIRQKDGPYFVDMHPKTLLNLNLGLQLSTRKGILWLHRTSSANKQLPNTSFNEQQLKVLEAVMSKYGNHTDIELKRAAYTTKHMRAVLRAERELGANLFNTPLLTPSD